MYSTLKLEQFNWHVLYVQNIDTTFINLIKKTELYKNVGMRIFTKWLVMICIRYDCYLKKSTRKTTSSLSFSFSWYFGNKLLSLSLFFFFFLLFFFILDVSFSGNTPPTAPGGRAVPFAVASPSVWAFSPLHEEFLITVEVMWPPLSKYWAAIGSSWYGCCGDISMWYNNRLVVFRCCWRRYAIIPITRVRIRTSSTMKMISGRYWLKLSEMEDIKIGVNWDGVMISRHKTYNQCKGQCS